MASRHHRGVIFIAAPIARSIEISALRLISRVKLRLVARIVNMMLCRELTYLGTSSGRAAIREHGASCAGEAALALATTPGNAPACA